MTLELARLPFVRSDARTPRIKGRSIAAWRAGLEPRWSVERGRALRAEFRFADFAGAFALAKRIGALAERARHHPDLELGWGRLAVRITTHATGGLSANDFLLAARIDRLAR